MKGMSDDSQVTEEERTVGRLFVPSLVLSRYSASPRGVILTLLLIEIGLTFGVPVGVAGQIGTATSVAGFVGNLLMGLLTVRYRHKSLLMAGLVILGFSTLGLYLAPGFALFMAFSVLAGFGVAMIFPVSTTLVARHLSLEKRAGVISVFMAMTAFSYFIGTPIIQYISGLGGWRLTYLIYALPLPVLGILLSSRGIPSESGSSQGATEMVNVVDGYKGVLSKVDGYKGVLSKLSADVCLLCNSLSAATWAGIGLYAISYYRQHFAVSKGFATYLLIFAALLYAVGALISGKLALISGKLVNRFGRKKMSSAAALLSGVFTFSFTVSSNLWVSIILVFMACIAAGVRVSSQVALTLEQVPDFRGTMMSLSAASSNLGYALGSGVGGVALLWFGYRAIGPSLGLLGMISAVLLYRFVVDTTGA
jgi:predicted MFS family arabinose efflux permease